VTGIRRVSQLGTTGESTYVDGSIILGTDTTGNYVSTVVAGTAISVSGATGNVTVTNAGVTALTTSSGLSTNTSATGAVSVTNTGVTSAIAGTGVSVSGATGAVTLSIGQSVATNVSPTFAGINVTAPISGLIVGTNYTATWGGIEGNRGYLLLNNSASDSNIYLRSKGDTNVYIGGNNQNTLAVTGTSVTAPTYYANSWFRSNGATGWFNETYAGGIFMEDTTWVKVYNSKRFYGSLGFASSIQYGNYGSMSVWGKNNSWAGICFPDNAVTWMQLDDSQFGVYRQNSTWNFYYYYGSFTASDSRYKREIKPLEYGLNLINALKPVEFKRLTERNDDDPEAVEEEIFYGFLAQEIKEALDSVGETRDTNLWDLGGPEMPLTPSDRQYINEIELIPPIVKALQELDARLKLLEGGI
jgi:hypothetical protein